MVSYKIIVTGPFNSGKTEFIRTISDIPVVSTEKKITTEDKGIKAETTVALDYGRAVIDGTTLLLYGTPGQTRFDFMWEILSEEMDGFLVLVDSTDQHSFAEAANMITIFSKYLSVPRLIVANKTDLPGSETLTSVRRGTQANNHTTVMPCVATQKSSVRQVLLQMISILRHHPSRN
jgi:small GTP-binding protein